MFPISASRYLHCQYVSENYNCIQLCFYTQQRKAIIILFFIAGFSPGADSGHPAGHCPGAHSQWVWPAPGPAAGARHEYPEGAVPGRGAGHVHAGLPAHRGHPGHHRLLISQLGHTERSHTAARSVQRQEAFTGNYQ